MQFTIKSTFPEGWILGELASEICLKTARLKMTPFFRHCETSHGKYIAVLMQTDVKLVAESTPAPSCSLGTERNYQEPMSAIQ